MITLTFQSKNDYFNITKKLYKLGTVALIEIAISNIGNEINIFIETRWLFIARMVTTRSLYHSTILLS